MAALNTTGRPTDTRTKVKTFHLHFVYFKLKSHFDLIDKTGAPNMWNPPPRETSRGPSLQGFFC